VTLFEFSSEKSVLSWYSQNDTVMGGVSSSQMTFFNDSIAKFSGRVSLENNGGFAQVKYDKTRFDLKEFNGLELRIKGDNKTYQLRLQTDAGQIAYSASLLASSDWQTLRLAFADFKPTFRGRDVLGAPRLNQSSINAVALMVSDKQTGEFELLIDYIKAFSSPLN
jgi:monofunctional biosynthetic peptidoglycan transglycosylase